MNKLSKAFLPIMVASAMMRGNDMPYGYDYIKRPKRNVVFEHKDSHQDKGVCSKKVRKGAGKRLSKAERKRIYGKSNFNVNTTEMDLQNTQWRKDY